MYESPYKEYLSRLPHEWEKVAIERLGNISAGGTPSRDVPSFWNGTIAWVTPAELTTLKGKWLCDTNERITEKGLRGSGAKLLPAGSLLVTTRATIGSIAIAAIPVSTNQGFKNIAPNESADSNFYYHLLHIVAPELIRLASGSTFLEISRRDFMSILVPRPKIDEQRRIAGILDTIDAAIQQTDALVAKLDQIKAGLMHDLLTRGLDPQDNLRDPEMHPEQFKDSELGWIPKEWNVKSLREFSVLQRGFDLPNQARSEGIYPVYGSNGLNGFHHSYTVKGPGVVTGRSGSIGFVYYIDSDFWALNTTLYVKDFRGNNPRFVKLVLELLQLARFAAATGVPSLNRNFIHPLPVRVPLVEEQDRIVKIIDAQDAHIRAEVGNRDKLKAVKQGLMQDLLTGRVRIAAPDQTQP